LHTAASVLQALKLVTCIQAIVCPKEFWCVSVRT